MGRKELIELMQENTITSSKVIEHLNISNKQVTNLNATGILVAFKKGIYYCIFYSLIIRGNSSI